MNDSVMKLSEDMLEKVTGGAARPGYSDSDLEKAGVKVAVGKNGKKTYSVVTSDGKKRRISKNTALDVCDCYKIAGNVQLSGAELDALIQQGTPC